MISKIREKLMEWDKYSEDGWIPCMVVLDMVNKIENDYNNGWISVEDRLPETFDDVLVSCEGKIINDGCDGENVEFVADAYMYYKNCWRIQGRKYIKSIKVLAWQPLPKRYKPKGE